eukprot:6907080-Prymnesium_polylepis.1
MDGERRGLRGRAGCRVAHGQRSVLTGDAGFLRSAELQDERCGRAAASLARHHVVGEGGTASATASQTRAWNVKFKTLTPSNPNPNQAKPTATRVTHPPAQTSSVAVLFRTQAVAAETQARSQRDSQSHTDPAPKYDAVTPLCSLLRLTAVRPFVPSRHTAFPTPEPHATAASHPAP